MKFILLLALPILSPAYAKSKAPSKLAPCEGKKLVENCWVKPCSIPLDFDGNGQADTAYLVSKGKDGPKGIAIVLNKKTCLQAGAGTATGNGGEDFTWLNNWSLTKSHQGKQDGLSVNKDEIGGTLYLKNSSIHWEQAGD